MRLRRSILVAALALVATAGPFDLAAAEVPPAAAAPTAVAEQPAGELDRLVDLVRSMLAVAAGVGRGTLDEAQRDGRAVVADRGAPMLAEWIRHGRAAAVAAGVGPIPAETRARLRGFFDDALLDRTRFRVGWPAEGTVGVDWVRLLRVRAVALGDVVVFRDAQLARDPVLWAHELEHLRQYARWGVDDFADRYIRDSAAVEREAWDVAAAYKMWALQHGRLADAAPAPSATPRTTR